MLQMVSISSLLKRHHLNFNRFSKNYPQPLHRNIINDRSFSNSRKPCGAAAFINNLGFSHRLSKLLQHQPAISPLATAAPDIFLRGFQRQRSFLEFFKTQCCRVLELLSVLLGLTPRSTRTQPAPPTSLSHGSDFISSSTILPPVGPVTFIR